MQGQIQSAFEVLRQFQDQVDGGASPMIDRPEIVAHATLSAFASHWPAQATAAIHELLAASAQIKAVERSRWAVERSRWVVQRRIALSKLARAWNAAKLAAAP